MPEPSRFPPTPRAKFDTVRMLRLAERQFGVVNRRQLIRLGASAGRISRMLDRGFIHRIHPKVYAVGHRALSVEGWLSAALLYAGPGAVLSHLTAGWWRGILDERPSRIHVSAAGSVSSLRGVCIRHPRQIDRVWHRKLPITPVPRTLLDIAASQPLPTVRHALAEAAYNHVLDLDEVEAALGRGKPGSAALRLALDRHEPRLAATRSELERRFLLLCERAGFPLPEVNHRVSGLTVDAVWTELGLAVELDGHRGHDSRYAIERDRRRELILRAAGLLVVRYTWEQVTRDAPAVEADLGATIRELASSAPDIRAQFGSVG